MHAYSPRDDQERTPPVKSHNQPDNDIGALKWYIERRLSKLWLCSCIGTMVPKYPPVSLDPEAESSVSISLSKLDQKRSGESRPIKTPVDRFKVLLALA